MGATTRALRGHAHISQIALGRRVAMHANYLGAIERGEIGSPGLDTVDRMTCGLDVSIAVPAWHPPRRDAWRYWRGLG